MQLFIIAFILIHHAPLDSIGSFISYPHLSKFNVVVASFHASIPYPLATKKQQPFFHNFLKCFQDSSKPMMLI